MASGIETFLMKTWMNIGATTAAGAKAFEYQFGTDNRKNQIGAKREK